MLQKIATSVIDKGCGADAHHWQSKKRYPINMELRIRRVYQSEYFVPSSAIACDFEYTSNTLPPPQLDESKSS